MYSLFIDTHFKNILIGLFKEKKLVDTIYKKDVINTSEIVMSNINEILTRNNCDSKILSEVVVCNGPGSFTGVRVGVTIAKTFAYLLNIPIYTISSLELVAITNDLKDGMYGVKENNGVYIEKMTAGKFNENINYLKNTEILSINDKILYENELNIENLFEHNYLLHTTNSFDVNPLYVKSINVTNK